MAKCVICNRIVSDGSFNTKDKFELFGHTFICRDCASKIGIKSALSASAYNAEKAISKYRLMYPNDFTRTQSDVCESSMQEPHRKDNARYQPTTRKEKKHGFLKTVLIAFLCFVLIGAFAGRNNSSDGTSPNHSTASGAGTDSASLNKSAETTPAAPTTNLKVGDVVTVGDLEIALSYVKRSNIHTNSMGVNVDIPEGDEVVYAFFEVHNAGGKLQSFSKGKVSAYADSIKVEDIPDYMLFEEDGVKEYQSYELDGGMYAVAPFNFEVNAGWKSFTIFYGDCSWTVSSDEVSSDPYTFCTSFNHSESFTATSSGETADLKKYSLTFDGIDTIAQKYTWDGPWVVFKFTIKNTNSEVLDLSLVGHEMRCYQNDYLTREADYGVDDLLEGYTNIFDIREIKPDMSAKVYAAFAVKDPSGQFSMAFDDGYGFHNTAWIVNAEVK